MYKQAQPGRQTQAAHEGSVLASEESRLDRENAVQFFLGEKSASRDISATAKDRGAREGPKRARAGKAMKRPTKRPR